MSDNQDEDVTEVTETESEETTESQKKPSETLDFWKQQAKKNEARAKSNAAAAKRLAELEDANKSEAEKAADKIAKAEAEMASVPAKVAEALKAHLVALHGIDDEDAELFLTATEPDLLQKQVTRLLLQATDKRRSSKSVPREGNNPNAGTSDMREITRNLFGTNN